MRRNLGGAGLVGLLFLAGSLAACASGSTPADIATGAGATTERVSAAEAETLREPALQDSLVTAEAAFTEAQSARATGDLERAEAAYLRGLRDWPINREAWQGLESVYAEQGRSEDVNYARFFFARMDWANEQPPLIAAAAFDNLAEGRGDWQAPDARYGETAAQARDFLRALDREGRFRPAPEAVPWYLAILPSGVLTALLLTSAGGGI